MSSAPRSSRLGGPSQQIPDGRTNFPGRPIEIGIVVASGLDVVGRVCQQAVSLPEGLAHQRNSRVLQVAGDRRE